MRHQTTSCCTAQTVWNYFSNVLEVAAAHSDTVFTRFLRWSTAGNQKSDFGFACYLLPFFICWNLWLFRNSHRFDESIQSTASIIWRVSNQLKEHMALFKPHCTDNSIHRRRHRTLKKPTAGATANRGGRHQGTSADGV